MDVVDDAGCGSPANTLAQQPEVRPDPRGHDCLPQWSTRPSSTPTIPQIAFSLAASLSDQIDTHKCSNASGQAPEVVRPAKDRAKGPAAGTGFSCQTKGASSVWGPTMFRVGGCEGLVEHVL